MNIGNKAFHLCKMHRRTINLKTPLQGKKTQPLKDEHHPEQLKLATIVVLEVFLVALIQGITRQECYKGIQYLRCHLIKKILTHI